ncbi:hypothetical protein GA0070616_1157 [Micromonospora nigra]|uniref:Uncharacterized protein n=1 Tax=Micromonospora nigra TaxID=145857 RepID=A0A1C6RIQ3_9ACTN|nr:hypothetical protein GA0070616_1157 [Micromonospora nigra]
MAPLVVLSVEVMLGVPGNTGTPPRGVVAPRRDVGVGTLRVGRLLWCGNASATSRP